MMDRRSAMIGAVALAALPGALSAALPIPPSRRLGFDILRKGSKLGTHVLTFEPGGDSLTVHVAVDLVYKIAGITLYHYRHQATERWQGQQVIALDAETSDNGTPYKVTARREGGVLMVQGTKAPRYAAPTDALPATHWNRHELDGPWINTQDGRIMRPHVAAQGIETIPAADGASLRARHYALTGDVQLDMFYDDHAGWAGLSFVKGGAPIRYERQA
ncbi:DUF6134 family protein [Novosphingobium sp.]|jgi:hypothetical protein|uniref:DUF6134 family protein n=1 Tax=Novosphingobium sp. TaxID=1874826 RepID=UPI0031D639F7